MSLAHRIAAVAGLAVARGRRRSLAVGQLTRATRVGAARPGRRARCAERVRSRSPARRARRGAPDGATATTGAFAGPADRRRARFGGRRGLRAGRRARRARSIRPRPSVRRRRCPVDADGARTIAASGTRPRRSPTTPRVDGDARCASSPRARRARRGAGRAPAHRGRQRAARPAPAAGRSSARGGIAARRGARASSWRARRCARSRRFTRRTESLTARPGPVAAARGLRPRRDRPPGPQLQHDAGRARALGRGPAQPGRRRQPRAAYADRQPAGQHPDPERRRPPLAEERAALRADIIAELDELTALVADVVELARGTKPTGEPDDVRLDAHRRATWCSARGAARRRSASTSSSSRR